MPPFLLILFLGTTSPTMPTNMHVWEFQDSASCSLAAQVALRVSDRSVLAICYDTFMGMAVNEMASGHAAP